MKIESIVALVKKYPGLDATALKGKGCKGSIARGILKKAEDAGKITYINGGWWVKREDDI